MSRWYRLFCIDDLTCLAIICKNENTLGGSGEQGLKFWRFCEIPSTYLYTYTRTQQSPPPLWAAIITKIFLLCTLNDIASFNLFKFCWFEQSISTLKFKVSASKHCCFWILLIPNLWKIARQFKILAILYFHRFIIIFLYLTLHCNKCFLLLN